MSPSAVPTSSNVLDGREVKIAPLETIDFARLAANDPIEVSRLHRCCETHGFFYLYLQGTEAGQQVLSDEKDVLRVMETYFDQPLDVKMKDQRVAVTQSGYKPVGLFVGADEKSKDGYERVKVVGAELVEKSPNIPAMVYQNFELFDGFTSRSRYVTKTILACLASALSSSEAHRVEQSHRDEELDSSNILILHYPKNLDESNIGNTKHTDIGSLTLLFTDQWGLQVVTPEDKTWVYVQPKAGHAIMNVGDSLRFLSGKRFNSCLHRVIPVNGIRQEEDRYTIAYFLRPEDNAEFEEVDGQKVTAVQWRNAKNVLYETPGDHQQMSKVLAGGMEQILVY